jgi:Arc/MetJ family transcription regulator
MRITVDVDASTVSEIQRETGVSKKSPAIAKALDEYLREIRKRKLIQKVMEGRTDYGSTNEDLESVPHDTH